MSINFLQIRHVLCFSFFFWFLNEEEGHVCLRVSKSEFDRNGEGKRGREREGEGR